MIKKYWNKYGNTILFLTALDILLDMLFKLKRPLHHYLIYLVVLTVSAIVYDVLLEKYRTYKNAH